MNPSRGEKGFMMLKKLNAIACAMLLVCFAGAAEAKRTVQDQDPDGNPIFITVGGYCDLDQTECGATPLGYTVDFGGGNIIDSVIIYGNGLLTLGGTAIDMAPENFDNYDGTLGYFGANSLTPGLDNVHFPDAYFNDGFEQQATLSIAANGTVLARYGFCFTNGCNWYSSLTITPQADGLNVTFSGDFERGVSIPGATPVVTPDGYFLAARVTGLPAVPEPATWAMMTLAFAAVGGALRRRPRTAAGRPATNV